MRSYCNQHYRVLTKVAKKLYDYLANYNKYATFAVSETTKVLLFHETKNFFRENNINYI